MKHSTVNVIQPEIITTKLQQVAILGVLSLTGLFGVSCGKRQPPQPPVERARQRVEIKTEQKGNKILLTWRMPIASGNTSDRSKIRRADIYRLASAAGNGTTVNEEDFASDSTLIQSIDISDDDLGKDFSFEDTLSLAGQPVTLRYAVRLVNGDGQRAGFSNLAVIEPAARVAQAPTDLSVTYGQDAIALSWKNPQSNIDGTTPVNLLGVNVYRSEGTGKPFRLINRNAISSSTFSDADFEFGVTYNYRLRAVSLGANGGNVESSDSQSISLTPVDTFPPAAPSSITIAASPRTVSIFFASNLESDIAGYRVYRSTEQSLPPDRWRLLTAQPIRTNTFQDDDVESGVTYFYFVIAIDKAGNVSARSAVVSETAP